MDIYIWVKSTCRCCIFENYISRLEFLLLAEAGMAVLVTTTISMTTYMENS